MKNSTLYKKSTIMSHNLVAIRKTESIEKRNDFLVCKKLIVINLLYKIPDESER